MESEFHQTLDRLVDLARSGRAREALALLEATENAAPEVVARWYVLARLLQWKSSLADDGGTPPADRRLEARLRHYGSAPAEAFHRTLQSLEDVGTQPVVTAGLPEPGEPDGATPVSQAPLAPAPAHERRRLSLEHLRQRFLQAAPPEVTHPAAARLTQLLRRVRETDRVDWGFGPGAGESGHASVPTPAPDAQGHRLLLARLSQCLEHCQRAVP
ncbi:MAG: hypothetical protein H7831_10315 [Magnetococcus sp. WYHC-3]